MHKLIGYVCCLAGEALLIGVGRIEELDAWLSLIAHLCAAVAGLVGLWHIWRTHGHRALRFLQQRKVLKMNSILFLRILSYAGPILAAITPTLPERWQGLVGWLASALVGSAVTHHVTTSTSTKVQP